MQQSPDNDFLDAALMYASWGWRVFPLAPRCKTPITSHGCKDATTDPATIRQWWSSWPDANVGIATGPESGLAVVDLDVSEGKNGIVEWDGIADAKPETAAVATGGGGVQLYYLDAGGKCRNSQSKLAKGVDTRGAGGYVVAPPSIHPSGNPYGWVDHPEETAPAELPAWIAERLAPPAPTPAPVTVPGSSRLNAAGGPDAFERCRLYVEHLPAAISGSGGHAATFRVACEAYRFGLDDNDAWRILSDYNAGKCSPPWSERELRHKLRQGKESVAREGRTGEKLASSTSSAPALPPVFFPTSSPEAAPRIEVADEPDAEPEIDPPYVAPKEFPERLLNPPGIVGEMCRWMTATAYKPQPILNLANALAFWGAVIGRKVRTPTDLRTNLYCLGVGESGCGKDHSRKSVKRICEAAGLTAELLGGEELSSDTAIATAAYANPSLIFQLDEIGHMLSQAGSKFAAAHQKNIAPTFTRLFTSASTTVIGKAYANGDRKDLVQPNVCLYGTTVPGRLYEGLTPRDIVDGFMGRMLVFVSTDPDPVEHANPITPVPAAIVDAAAAWFHRKDLPSASSKSLAVTHEPITIPFDADADRVIKAFTAECRGLKARERAGGGLDALWARAVEHACKVALTLACGVAAVRPDKTIEPVSVDATTATLAVDLVRHLTATLVESVRENITDSEFGRHIQRVRRAIADGGEKGISNRKLLDKTQGMLPEIRHKALSELEQSGAIYIYERRTGARGSATRMYRLKSSGITTFSPN